MVPFTFSAKIDIPIMATQSSSRYEPGMTESFMAVDDSDHRCAITKDNDASRWWAGKLGKKTVVTHVELTMSLKFEGDQSNEKTFIHYNDVIMSTLTSKITSLTIVYSTVNSGADDVIMSTLTSKITSLTIVYSTVNSGADQRKHQSSASLTFVRGIYQWPANSPHKLPVTRENVSIWWRHRVLQWHIDFRQLLWFWYASGCQKSRQLNKNSTIRLSHPL